MAFKQTYNLVIRARDRARPAFTAVGGYLGRLNNRLGHISKAVTTLAFGIVPVVRSMSRMVSGSIKLGDTIAKTSAAIGLSTTTLQEYHHAAELAGVGANRFNSAVKGFAKRLGELQATGGKRGTLAEYLRDGNEELLRMLVGVKDADQGLDVFLNAIDKTGSQLQKAGLAAAGFGRQAGVDMTVLLRDGIGALRETRQEAHDLGIVMSQSTTSIAERATDSFYRLWKSLKQLFVPLIIRLAGFVAHLADAFVFLIKQITAATDAVIGFFDRLFLPTDDQRFTKLVKERVELTKGLAMEQAAYNKLAEDGISVWERNQAGIIEKRIEGIRRRLADVRSQMSEISTDTMDAEVDGGVVRDPGGEATGLTEYQKASIKVQEIMRKDRERFDAIITRMTWNRIRDEERARKEAADREAKRQKDLLSASKEALEEYKRDRLEALEEIRGAEERLDMTVRDSAVDGLTALATGYGDLRQIAVRALNDILKAMLDVNQAGQAQGNIFSGIGAALSGLFGGTGGGVRADGFSTSGQYAGFASGGRPPVGRPSIVGERGPELFVPDSAGTVVPNDAMGGGVTVNQTINVHPDVSRVAQQQVLEMMPMIKSAAVSGVSQERQRRGNAYTS